MLLIWTCNKTVLWCSYRALLFKLTEDTTFKSVFRFTVNRNTIFGDFETFSNLAIKCVNFAANLMLINFYGDNWLNFKLEKKEQC